MKKMKTSLIMFAIFISSTFINYSQVCDDFTIFNWSPSGDTLGYTQSGMYPIVNIPYFGTATPYNWDLNQPGMGMYGISSAAQFSFDGTDQMVVFEIYGFFGQSTQMGFSVNGSTTTNLNQSFPIIVGGIVVNLDTSAANTANWDHAFLTFTGNVNNVEIHAFESGIKNLCLIEIQSLSVNKTAQNISFKIYPNPAKNQIRISNNQKIKTTSVYTITGQLLHLNQSKNDETIIIDISSLPSGLYIVRHKLINGAFESSKLIVE